MGGPGSQRARFPRRRDRRGRGLRSALTPATLPLTRTRADAFDDLVLDAVEELELRWAPQLEQIGFAVEQVPPDDEPSPDGDPVALSRIEPATPGDGSHPPEPTRIVLYRRPLEARGRSVDDLADLVLDVLIHDLARILDVTPEVIDPEGHGPEH